MNVGAGSELRIEQDTGLDNFNPLYYNSFTCIITGMGNMRKRFSLPYFFKNGLRLATASIMGVFLLLLTISPVFAVPTIIPTTLPNGRVNVSYSAVLTAFGVTGSATWHVASGSLPPGLTLNANTGVISGTPTTANSYFFIVDVTDDDGTSPQQGFNITITEPPLIFSTTTLPQATEGSAFSRVLSVTGGTQPYTWALSSGTLPTGITLDPTNGYLTGTPISGTAGSHTFMITVTDSSSPAQSTQQSFTLYIEEGTYNLTVTVGTGLENGKTKVYMDGQQVTSLSGGETHEFNVDLGASRTISVDATVADPEDDDIRYRVRDNEVLVTESQPTASFSYYTEYRVNVTTEPGGVLDISGGQWYREDETFSFNAVEEAEGNPGTLYRFSYWALPNGSEIETRNVSLTVDEPATVTANYDTYYLLTVESMYGEVEGGGWYEANTSARWTVVEETVPMTGLLGLFGAKYRAVNDTDTEVMDSPKTVTVFWEPDYSLAMIFIPLTVLVIAGIIVGLYLLVQRTRPKPAPYPGPAMGPGLGMPPPRPIPPRPIPHHTTVVMVQGDQGRKELPSSSTTKEQLMAKFGELLEIYEKEIQSNIADKGLPQAKPQAQEHGIPAPPTPIQHPALGKARDEEREEEEEDEDRVCGYSSKRLLRTVTGPWKQSESETVTLTEKEKQGANSKTGLRVVWSRDIYQEWEVLTCTLPRKHKGSHRGETEIIYTLLNTIEEKKTYSSRQKVKPPSPHFTDGMPELELDEDQIVPADELPEETAK